ncbi:hypothetical protein OOT08_15390, partial [Leucobacter sp. M11]|nr:hypothetical protein [Leucobacter sp. M11]
TRALAQGAGALRDGTRDAVTGSRQLSQGAEALRAGAERLNTRVADGTPDVQALNEGARRLDAGLAEYVPGVVSLAQGAIDLQEQTLPLFAGLRDLEEIPDLFWQVPGELANATDAIQGSVT